MKHLPLCAPACVKYRDRDHSAHVSRLLPSDNYAITNDETGVEIFSASFILLGIKIRFVHPDIGAAARIRLPNHPDWINCVVKELRQPPPTVLLEAQGTKSKSVPLFETDTFPAIKITLEYIESTKQNCSNASLSAPPPIGTDIEVRILGEWRTGKITQHQGGLHFVVQVPGVGRLFSQSFGLLEYETRIKRPHLGANAIIHLHSGDIACTVVEHSIHPHGYILAAIADETLYFDSRLLSDLDIKVTLTNTTAVNEEIREVSIKEEEITEKVLEYPASKTRTKRRREKSTVLNNESGDEIVKSNQDIRSDDALIDHHATKKPTKKIKIEDFDSLKLKTSQSKKSFRVSASETNGTAVKKAVIQKKSRKPNTAYADTDHDDERVKRIRKPNSVYAHFDDDDDDNDDDELVQIEDTINELAMLPKAKAITLLIRKEDRIEEENAKLDKIHDQFMEADLQNHLQKQFKDIPKGKMKQLLSIARSEMQDRKMSERNKRKSTPKPSGNYRVIIVENDGTQKKRYPHEEWMNILSHAVCVTYSVKHFVFPDNYEPSVFMFYGIQANTELAVQSFRNAFDYVHRLQLQYKYNRKKHGRKSMMQVRTSYALGIVQSLLKSAKQSKISQNQSAENAEKEEDVELNSVDIEKAENDLINQKLVKNAHEDGCRDSVKVQL